MNRGEVAAAADVNAETLRYYERRGLIPAPARSASGYRQYPAETVDRIQFVKQAQALGFSLEETKELLSLRATRGARAAQVRSRTQRKIAEIDRRIEELQCMRAALEHLVEHCSGEGSASGCTILHAIEQRGAMRGQKEES